jgi:hypothetical protein
MLRMAAGGGIFHLLVTVVGRSGTTVVRLITAMVAFDTGNVEILHIRPGIAATTKPDSLGLWHYGVRRRNIRREVETK